MSSTPLGKEVYALKIIVSACLAGENCKYNGGNNWNDKVMALYKENEIITVCPEVMGGLPTPRVPSEIVSVEWALVSE